VSQVVAQELSQVLRTIDRPGSFCVSGSVPAVLPGLEVDGLGPIGFPLTSTQAEELKHLCEQAPYGKGEETLVDLGVRRVWRLKPERFALKGPDWEPFLKQTLRKVREELGLERQKLESHLYELLLYEPGSFFLPHRDGEKLDRMVATLVIMLPSSFAGGELVVRHDGQELVIDASGDSQFRIHFAAFYADCEHEIRSLRAGHRLCLVYNLTLARSKKPLGAPRHGEQVEIIAEILRRWVKEDAPRKLAITLEHQYTQDGLAWDVVKGVDRAQAQALAEAARQADCQAHLALLTLHESGAAEGAGRGYRGRGRWRHEEDDPSLYVMGEIYETSLTAEHWSDPAGNRLPLGRLVVVEDEVLDPELLQAVDPEEQVEGYTGNEGMTYDRWYRHAAVILWPNRRHFDILCDARLRGAVKALELWVSRWQQAARKDAAALRAECIDFAGRIIARWEANPFAGSFGQQAEPCTLLESLQTLAEPELIKGYLRQVLARDATADPGKSLVVVCQDHGWAIFQAELEAVCKATTGQTLERNVRLLDQLCLASPRKKEGWAELCQALAQALMAALERIDQEAAPNDWRARPVARAAVLAGLALALLATEQVELLARLVAHALARPEKYPLTDAHLAALMDLGPWLKKNVKEPVPALAHWLDACIGQLEALTAQEQQPPANFRRAAAISCKCADCAELRRFLDDPAEKEHRFRAVEARRRHLQDIVCHHHCDLDLRTEKRGSPHTLVCTKNDASSMVKLRTFHLDQEHLAALRAIRQSVPG
jgi:hypothetical protein